MSVQRTTFTLQQATISDRYVVLLAFLLLGYAFAGKGFAYLGMPPLFVGEAAFILGAVVFLTTGNWIAVMAAPASLFLLALIVWILARTIPNLGLYGLDALRDSVIVLYGGFAFITIALLLEKPERVRQIFRYFSAFFAVFGAVGPLLFLLTRLLEKVIPLVPGTDTPLLNLRAGEVATHLSGAAVFALLGMRRVGVGWVIMLLAGIAIIGAQSRGGLLAIILPVSFALIVSGRSRVMWVGTLGFLTILAALYALDLEFTIPGDERPLSARQFIQNLLSVFGDSENAQLDGTKQWRVGWWTYIQNYTFHGDYFWSGKGFGMNLAVADGFVVGDPNLPPLRSPHSAHMTILARSGVPGLVLWAATLVSVLATLIKNMVVARGRGDHDWANFFLFLTCYLTAIIIDASFDVALEGPIVGIWFWVLVGLAIGSTMVYRGLESRRLTYRIPRSVPFVVLVAVLSVLAVSSTEGRALASDPSAAPVERGPAAIPWANDQRLARNSA